MRRNILFVDDEPMLLDGFKRMLPGMRGYFPDSLLARGFLVEGEYMGERKVREKKSEVVSEVAALSDLTKGYESFTKEHPFATNDRRLHEALYTWIIQDSPVFMLALGPDGRILQINETLLQVIGRTKEEVVGIEDLTGLIPESDHDALTRLFGIIGPSPKTIRLETHLIAPNGQSERAFQKKRSGRQVFVH
ncbi:MAG: PAS domain S-box protein [Syntrophobacteraceae bacterium]